MSNNQNSQQGQAADPAATPNQPPSSSSLQSAVPAVGPQNAVGRPPPRPIFISPLIPAVPRPVQMTIDLAALTKVIARDGTCRGARIAEIHHRRVNPANPLTYDELMARVVDCPQRLGVHKFQEFHQGSSNAVALRLLAPRAGPSYEFEDVETSFTDRHGKTTVGKKCGHPGCEYRNYPDRKRHMAEMHVKDIATALCCPIDGCEKVHYNASRDSEMRLHIGRHEKKNARAQRQGPEVLMTSYRLDIPDEEYGLGV